MGTGRSDPEHKPRPPMDDGFVNLFKPPGITSMDALRRIKRITGQRQKVGHGGTMDPLARGVLPVCFGQATRLMDHIIGGVKIYRAEVKLGITTTTYDAEGEVVKRAEVPGITQNILEENLKPWIGMVNQTPPMYSAIKMDGKRLYKLARAGIEVERKARPVEIHRINVLEFDYPKLVIEVECGKGTYIRSLAHDLGETLGCGGHIVDLVRLRCGSFAADESVTLEQLEEAAHSQEGWQKYLLPLDRVLTGLKSITLGTQAETHLRHGQAISSDQQQLESGYSEEYRAYSHQGVFLALIKFDWSSNTWRPVKVFQPSSSSPYAPDSI